jgi:predicted RNase H-like HicB family nuclease
MVSHFLRQMPASAPMWEYFAVICKTPIDGFVAIFPDLPGCVAFSGTLKSIWREASLALGEYVADAERSGVPVPIPSTSDAIRADPQNLGCYIGRVRASRQAS